jgi:hypothetical protein
LSAAKPGINPRTLLLAAAVGALELAILVGWLVKDAEVSAWLR